MKQKKESQKVKSKALKRKSAPNVNAMKSTRPISDPKIFDSRDIVVKWAKEIGIKNKVIVIIRRSDIETEAQRRIDEEYDKVEWVGTDKSICGCSLIRTYELPCACELVALMNAVGIVFPHAVNLLCRFHIEKNVGAKCKQYVLKDRQESILNMWKDIMYCSNEKEYMMRLHMFEQSCVDTKVFVDYVKETWLTPHKERFVEAWTNKVMHLGNTTTNRVESAHWKLKLMLENSMGDLCKCWEAMNNMIRLQHKRIRASFQKSFYDEEHEHRNPFYQRLNTFVSTEAQRRIAEEYDKVEWVGTDKSICGCSLRRTYGLPCACELGQYKLMGEPIPLDSVHIQWRKLSMECELTQDTEDGSELDMSTEMNALWKRFRSLDVIGKRVLKSKVRELAFPSTSSLCPPPEKIKTKGIVKKSKGMKPDGYDVYRDPSYFEHVNATHCEDFGSQPSQSKKRQVSQSKKQPSQSSQSSKHLLWRQFPDIIQPYIDDIFDVAADGNCGFRDIALLLGFGEEFQKMKDGFPMPDIAPGWKQYRTNEATSWTIAYTGRLQHWWYLLGRLPRVIQNPPTELVDAMSLDEP
ncbi:uncharacterized protein [Cicer arietinum]|uniref:uncharacterized protein n=1 Tax=Cicer arietinum TaxID=3827 RepID=UPI003CC5BDC6